MAHSHTGHLHGLDHDHEHGHDHGADHARRLRVALYITALILVAEIVGGFAANSLALLADAGHMLTDVAALGLSLFASSFGNRPETPKRTYGYRRLEILAAFLNGATLLLVSGFIVYEAIRRITAPEPVGGTLMLIVAAIGLAANVVAARTLHPASSGSLNVRGAYIHVIGDLLGSVGALIAALLIRFTGWLPADPIASIVVTLLVIRSAWLLVRESVDVLLESTPANISAGAVRTQLEAIPGVESVHDLHVWSVTSGVVAMSAHAIVRESDRHQHVLEHVHDAMRLFGIQHVTIQLERREMYEREMHLHA
ncbi:MAG TPA: cation diffusion facilitator family transporter [Gemmatimonadaceae bacterium]|jgi:cobalt-zinc-cadmium efflux system protein